jgi:hypothetical protein
MNRVHNKSIWTQKEIFSLKRGFLEGENIKRLSKQLGRSPSALHKALSRFKIRHNVSQIRSGQKSIHLHAPIHAQQTIRTSINVVVIYLKNYGYNITQKTMFINGKCMQAYFLSQRPITAIRLLVMANNIRLDEKNPIFVIEQAS